MARRANGEGSIYQRRDGRWVGVAHVGYANGRRVRKFVYAQSQREVRERLQMVQRDVQHGVPPANDQARVGQYLSQWLEETARPRLRPLTYSSYSGIVRLHLVPGLGNHRLARLTQAQIQSFLNAKREAGLSPRRVQYIHAVLRAALADAERADLVGRNVAKLARGPRVVRHEITPLTPAQARTLLHSLQGNRLEALYTVAVAVGLRKGEALGLRWEDVNLEAGTLSVRHALQRIDGRQQLVEPKTERSRRTVRLPRALVDALRSHQERQLAECEAAGAGWRDLGYVFTTPSGTPLDEGFVYRAFQEALRVAGLPRVRFHDLRHTCATLLLAQGVPMRVVMETLGHSQISLTSDTYSHVVDALRQEAADRMDAILTVA